MSAAKTERLLNLTMALLATRRFLTKAEIFNRVAGYSGAPEANDRMFERDKEDLRELGIPLVTGGSDPLLDLEDGYRIDPKAYSLPPIVFTPSEASVIAVAAQIWREYGFAEPAKSGLRKLRAAGEDLVGEEFFRAQVSGKESSFPTIWGAVKDRCRISFDYRRKDGEISRREVEPWGVLSWHGAWYLVGMDLAREDSRVFRLSRFTSETKVVSKTSAFEVPESLNLRDLVTHSGNVEEQLAILRVAKNCGLPLRRRAVETKSLSESWDEIRLSFTDLDSLAREVLWLANKVIVVEPQLLRTRVMDSLKVMAR